MTNIVISAGWRNTGGFFEKECLDFNEAFAEAPSFYDRARGDWSSANALVLSEIAGEMRAAPWQEAQFVWENAAGNETHKRLSVIEFMSASEDRRSEMIAALMDTEDPSAPYWAIDNLAFRRLLVAAKVNQARWGDAPGVGEVWADVARAFGFTVTRSET